MITTPLTPLTALSPLDGRYQDKLGALRELFSEYGLLKYRCIVEIRWLQQLAATEEITEIPPFDAKTQHYLEQLIENFDTTQAEQIKTIEQTTRHDVKALEYFLKAQLTAIPALNAAKEYLHFACTSEDINNLAYGLMLRQAREMLLLPLWGKLIPLKASRSIDAAPWPITGQPQFFSYSTQ